MFTGLDGRTVINNGTATLTGGGSLSFQNGAVFDNNGAFTSTGSFGYSSVPGGGACGPFPEHAQDEHG